MRSLLESQPRLLSRSGNAILIALVVSLVVGIGLSAFLRLGDQDRRAQAMLLGVQSERGANAAAIEMANELIRSNAIRGFNSLNPPGTYYYAFFAPPAPPSGAGGTWTFQPGFLESDGQPNVAELTVYVCNPAALSSTDLSPLFSPTPVKLPLAARCAPGALVPGGGPAAFRHRVRFLRRSATGVLTLQAMLMTPIPTP